MKYKSCSYIFSLAWASVPSVPLSPVVGAGKSTDDFLNRDLAVASSSCAFKVRKPIQGSKTEFKVDIFEFDLHEAKDLRFPDGLKSYKLDRKNSENCKIVTYQRSEWLNRRQNIKLVKSKPLSGGENDLFDQDETEHGWENLSESEKGYTRIVLGPSVCKLEIERLLETGDSKTEVIEFAGGEARELENIKTITKLRLLQGTPGDCDVLLKLPIREGSTIIRAKIDAIGAMFPAVGGLKDIKRLSTVTLGYMCDAKTENQCANGMCYKKEDRCANKLGGVCGKVAIISHDNSVLTVDTPVDTSADKDCRSCDLPQGATTECDSFAHGTSCHFECLPAFGYPSRKKYRRCIDGQWGKGPADQILCAKDSQGLHKIIIPAVAGVAAAGIMGGTILGTWNTEDKDTTDEEEIVDQNEGTTDEEEIVDQNEGYPPNSVLFPTVIMAAVVITVLMTWLACCVWKSEKTRRGLSRAHHVFENSSARSSIGHDKAKNADDMEIAKEESDDIWSTPSENMMTHAREDV